MKVIFTFVIIILLNSSLGAYTRQIVFDSFKDKESANAALEKLKSDEIYSNLELISKENDFDIHVIASGGKNLLVAEPIKNQYILEETLKLIVPKFLNAVAVNIEKASQQVEQTSSLDASLGSEYPKKIILQSCSKKETADEELKKFQEDEAYEKLNSLATKNDFVIHVRPLGNYTVLIIEPIENQEIHAEVMNLIAPKFEGVYSLKYDVIDGVTQTKEEEKKLELSTAVAPAVMPVKTKAADKNSSATKANANITELVAQAAQNDTNISAVLSDDNKSKTDTNITAIKADGNTTPPLAQETNTTKSAIKESAKATTQETKVVATSIKEEEKKTVYKEKEEIQEESSIAMYVWLFILSMLLGAIIYIYPKAKRIYDQY